MKSGIIILMVVTILFVSASCATDTDKDIESPNGEIGLELFISNAGEISYNASYHQLPVIENSRLGIQGEDTDFSSGLKLVGLSDPVPIRDEYNLKYGKKSHAGYIANQRTFHFHAKNGETLDVIIRVSNDGFAFKYEFPDKGEAPVRISNENTSFNFADGATAWIQPRARSKTGWNQVNPSYEEHYLSDTLLETLQPNDTGWVFPALVKTPACWVTLSESWPYDHYCGSHLNKGTERNELVISFPESSEGFTGGEVYPESTTPWSTPWRIIAMGTLETLFGSTLGTDMAEPAKWKDTDFVKPGRASWSWALMKDGSVNFDTQVQFINYAAQMGWEYCLIDVNWDTQIGWDGIRKLVRLAEEKGVGLILWYNSAGEWNTTPYHPKDMLTDPEKRKAEFARLQELGIKGVKVDFFGGDGQSMMRYYEDILTDAYSYGLVVNCHGATLPRGIQRTYPNLVSMESIRGFEYATFGQETADRVPIKATIIPFTRNIFDPMDFTPVCFTEYDNNRRVTGNAAELAQAVLFLSGVQHYAETPQGMQTTPETVQELMREIPVNWDESRLINAYPGSYIVMARRKGTTWYYAGINAEKSPLEISFKPDFALAKPALLVTEGDSLRSFRIEELSLSADDLVHVRMLSNGGFVLRCEQGDL